MKYVELKITDDYKQFVKCENTREECLVDHIQCNINAIYNCIQDYSYNVAKYYYSIWHYAYIEIHTYITTLYQLRMIDENIADDVKDVMHKYICNMVDAKKNI